MTFNPFDFQTFPIGRGLAFRRRDDVDDVPSRPLPELVMVRWLSNGKVVFHDVGHSSDVFEMPRIDFRASFTPAPPCTV